MSRRCLTSPKYKNWPSQLCLTLAVHKTLCKVINIVVVYSVIWIAKHVLPLQNSPRFWHSSLASGNWTLVFSPLEVQYVLNPDQVELDNVNFPGNIHWQQSINFCDWPSMVSFLNQIKCHLEAFYIFCFVQAYLSVLPSTDLYLFICSTSNRQCLQRTEILNNTKQTTRVCIFVHEKKKKSRRQKHITGMPQKKQIGMGVISSLELYVVFANDVHIAQPHLPTQSWCPHRLEEDQIAGNYLNYF